MKITKIIAVAAAAILLCMPFQQAKAQINLGNVANAVSGLTANNGNSAGMALLGLYTQFKADGNKLDFKNANNINNLITLATNVKDLGKLKDKASYVSGLIKGSKNLVNNNNSANVLSSLTQISNLDLSSLGTAAATAAASSAATSALSKLTGGSTTAASSTTNQATTQAASILTGLFKNLK